VNHPTKAAITGIKRYADGLDLNFSTAVNMHCRKRNLREFSGWLSLGIDVNWTERLLVRHKRSGLRIIDEVGAIFRCGMFNTMFPEHDGEIRGRGARDGLNAWPGITIIPTQSRMLLTKTSRQVDLLGIFDSMAYLHL
jgi:hypothetical protein